MYRVFLLGILFAISVIKKKDQLFLPSEKTLGGTGRNPGIIKKIIVHTQQEKHYLFKDEVPPEYLVVIVFLSKGGKTLLNEKQQPAASF